MTERKLVLFSSLPPLEKVLSEAFHTDAYQTVKISTYPQLDQVLAAHECPVAIFAPLAIDEITFLESDEGDWDLFVSKILETPMLMAQAAAKHMIARHIPGRIIFLSSVVALRSYAKFSITGSALAALHSVAKMAAVDLAPYGITVNVIALGWFNEMFLKPTSITDETLQANIPAGRYGELQQVAHLCRFLASDSASYLTGAVIPLDGGYSLTKAGAGTPPRQP